MSAKKRQPRKPRTAKPAPLAPRSKPLKIPGSFDDLIKQSLATSKPAK